VRFFHRGEGDVVWVEAWQVPVRAFSAFGNDHFLHGRPYVASVGLYDHRARFYEARTGTFLEPDPLGPVDSPNLYAAFGFDALSVTDPWGLERRTAHGGVNPLGDILNEWQISSQTSWWQYAGLIALDVLGNTVSDLLSLDVVADEAAVLGSSQESLGRRLWAGTKLAGITALNAGGGDVAVKALFGRLARWAPVQRLAQRLGPKLSSAFTRRAEEALSRADDLLAGERVARSTETAGALRAGEAFSQAVSLERFRSVGREAIPGVLQAFGDAVRPMGELPAQFAGRRVTTLGRTWDIQAAKELGGFRVLDLPQGEWSIERNYNWLMDAVKNGDVFYLASPVTEGALMVEDLNLKYGGVSVFMRELDALLHSGYRRVGDYLIPHAEGI
jgi:RHS repeat-associated protein